MTATMGLLWLFAASVEITVVQPAPTVGQATEIRLSETVDQVEIVSHPESFVEKRELVVMPSVGATMIEWIPSHAGVVSIEAGGSKHAVSVRYHGIPIAGLIVCLLAAVILFGGAMISLRRLLDD